MTWAEFCVGCRSLLVFPLKTGCCRSSRNKWRLCGLRVISSLIQFNLAHVSIHLASVSCYLHCFSGVAAHFYYHSQWWKSLIAPSRPLLLCLLFEPDVIEKNTTLWCNCKKATAICILLPTASSILRAIITVFLAFLNQYPLKSQQQITTKTNISL